MSGSVAMVAKMLKLQILINWQRKAFVIFTVLTMVPSVPLPVPHGLPACTLFQMEHNPCAAVLKSRNRLNSTTNSSKKQDTSPVTAQKQTTTSEDPTAVTLKHSGTTQEKIMRTHGKNGRKTSPFSQSTTLEKAMNPEHLETITTNQSIPRK